MGAIHVHEFVSLDGVIDTPSWTIDYEFLPRMEEAIGAVTDRCEGILLGRKTFEMFSKSWSKRTVEDDPGAPFFNDTAKYVVSGTATDAEATWRNSEVIGRYDPDAVRKLRAWRRLPELPNASVRPKSSGCVDVGALDLYYERHGEGPPLDRDGTRPTAGLRPFRTPGHRSSLS